MKRHFNQLIQEIEYEGEKFIPMVKIAALAFNYNEQTVLKNAKFWINKSYDCSAWHIFDLYQLDTNIKKGLLQIWDDYTISTYIEINHKTHLGYFCNQVKVFQLLTKWGFITS